MSRTLVLVVPGQLDTLTGGYGYDRRMLEQLPANGWRVSTVALDESFPHPTPAALQRASDALASIAADTPTLVDGLALGALPELARRERQRLRLIGLVHHPLSLETGLSPDVVAALERSERQALEQVRGIVTTSRATLHALAAMRVDPARCIVVEPGTDPAPLAAGSAAPPLELLCVATLIPRKGHALLIEALARLTHLPWRLTCVGGAMDGGSTLAALRERIEREGLDDRITFTGELAGAALQACYSRADVFVLPTLYEGYGMVVAEALAHGLPVVATRTGAIPELVETYDAGIVTPPADISGLHGALERLLSSSDERRRLAHGARLARAALSTWTQAGAKMSKALETIIDAPYTTRSTGP